jgi:mannose-6-phosphate isomerase-like protein (cupin superfamily)
VVYLVINEKDVLEKITLSGREREEALDKCYKIVASWGLKLPDVRPDPLHLGLNDFYNTGLIEFNINNDVEHGYCGKFLFMFKGQTCPRHHHKKKHETFFIVKGKVKMELNGRTFVMQQGDRLIVEQYARHQFTALEDSLILESSMPDLIDDSIFDDQRINKIIFGKEMF